MSYNKVGKLATVITKGVMCVDGVVIDSCMVCTYHSTDVVKWNDKHIRLYTGGWKTVTTKTRMNQVSNQFGLGYSVYQRKGKWYVDYNGVTQQFCGPLVVITRKETK